MILRRCVSCLLILLATLQLAKGQQQRRLPVFTAEALRQDFEFLYNVLEKAHPSLYWYTSEEDLHRYFTWSFNSITDSMNEVQFRNLVSYAVSKIRCGHTFVRASKAFGRYERFNRGSQFPFNVRVWSDTMAVSQSWLRGDSGLPRGTLITSINGRPVKEILHSLYEFMPMDGYSRGVNEIRLSYSFPSYYRNVYGTATEFQVGYTTLSGATFERKFSAYKPFSDSSRRQRPDSPLVKKPRPPKVPARQRKQNQLKSARSLRIDTLHRTAIMEVNTFSNGYKLRSFFRKSFRELEAAQLNNLVVDVRDNGGGNIRNYILLTRYLRHTPFRVADTVAAITKKMPAVRFMEAGFLNDIYMMFSAKKMRDDRYHFLYFEKHRYKPRKKQHFNGDLYVITSGQTFSAATLFASALKGQKGCTIVGEETGGGAYGNNGMLIPNVTLPNTRIRVTLPIFRMVINPDTALKGRGVFPDVEVKPSVHSISLGLDSKMERTLQLIDGRQKRTGNYSSSEK